MDKALVSGSTSMLLLRLLAEEDLYGYQMIERLRERSNDVFSLKAGTLYPLLHALEAQGAVESYEQATPDRRVRRYYHLTRTGRLLLEQKSAQWRAFSGAVERVLTAKGGASLA